MAVHDRPGDIRLDGHDYLLAREEQLQTGAVAWSVETVGSAIGQQSATESTYTHLASAIDMAMVWDTFHRGFGDEEKLDEGRYHYAQNLDCRFQGRVFPFLEIHDLELPADSIRGHIRRFVEQRNLFMAFNQQYALYIDPLGDTVTRHYDFGGDVAITDACSFGGDVIVARGYYDNAYYYSTAGVAKYDRSSRYDDGASMWGGESGEAFWSPMSGVALGHLTPSKDRLNASTSEYEVRWCSQSPQIQGNWTVAYRVGDPGTEITALAELGTGLYMGKRDGLYAFDQDDYAYQVTPELRSPAHADNCANMRAWHGSLWVPHQRGLFAYRSMGDSGFTVTSCSLGARAGQSSPVRGIVTAIIGDDRWLYAALWTGQNTYILAGREVRDDEGAYSPILWHTVGYLADQRVYTMHLSALGHAPRLYMGVGTGIKYINLPYGTDNPLQDGSCTFQTGTHSLYLSRHSWNAPSTLKLFKSVEILADRLRINQYIDVYYRTDNNASWIYLKRATMSPRHVMPFSDSGAGVAARRIELRLDICCDDESYPPILRTVIVRGAERPKDQDVITAIIRCADNMPDRRNGRLPDTGEQQLARLKALVGVGKAVVLDDMVGRKQRVIVLGPISETVPKQQGVVAREILATVRMTPFASEETSSLTGVGIWDVTRDGEECVGLDAEQ